MDVSRDVVCRSMSISDADTKHNPRLSVGCRRHTSNAGDILLRREQATQQRNIRTRSRRNGVKGEWSEWTGFGSVRRGVAVAEDMSRAGQSISWSFLSMHTSQRDRQDARQSDGRTLGCRRSIVRPFRALRLPAATAAAALVRYRWQPLARRSRPPSEMNDRQRCQATREYWNTTAACRPSTTVCDWLYDSDKHW